MNAFNEYWNKHHPHDWWASERDGKPLPSMDRLLVMEECRETWNAARDYYLAHAAQVCNETADKFRGKNTDRVTGAVMCALAIEKERGR